MSHVAIDPVHADRSAALLDAAARPGVPAPAPRSLTASSSLAAAITMLEHRLAALDAATGLHLMTHAVELRSAAEMIRRADR